MGFHPSPDSGRNEGLGRSLTAINKPPKQPHPVHQIIKGHPQSLSILSSYSIIVTCTRYDPILRSKIKLGYPRSIRGSMVVKNDSAYASNSMASCFWFSSKNRQTSAASGRLVGSMLQHASKRSQSFEMEPVQFSGRIAGGFPSEIAVIILN